jgi:hypothetical protein
MSSNLTEVYENMEVYKGQEFKLQSQILIQYTTHKAMKV